MSPQKQILLIQYGIGNVGRALVRQILDGRQALVARTGLALRHVALADSRGLLAEASGLNDDTLRAALEAKAQGRSLIDLPGAQARPLERSALPASQTPAILVDVTAASGMEAPASEALARGWGVVLANKRPLAGPWEDFTRLTTGGRLRHEATVGAGLPWVEVLTHLLDTGDRVLSLEAAVSGTLGFITSQLQAGAAFSAAVREAHGLGYTEPDPRDDLSAADVRRKGIILARMLGRPVAWDDLPAEPLYPAEWNGLSVDEFMAALPELDGSYAARMAAAQATGNTLRYAIRIDERGCSAALSKVASDSPLGALQGPNCLLSIHSERYHRQPLVISGPGAGAEVTAAGVYADLISLGRELP